MPVEPQSQAQRHAELLGYQHQLAVNLMHALGMTLVLATGSLYAIGVVIQLTTGDWPGWLLVLALALTLPAFQLWTADQDVPPPPLTAAD